MTSSAKTCGARLEQKKKKKEKKRFYLKCNTSHGEEEEEDLMEDHLLLTALVSSREVALAKAFPHVEEEVHTRPPARRPRCPPPEGGVRACFR